MTSPENLLTYEQALFLAIVLVAVLATFYVLLGVSLGIFGDRGEDR